MTSKLVTIKLIITVFLCCPFITYGMKRKRAEIESTPSTQNLIAEDTASPITTLDESIQNTATKIPPEILTAIINKTKEKNNGLFICHKDCNNHYSSEKSFRSHLLRKHASQFKCSLCNQAIPETTLKDAQKRLCPKSEGRKHKIENYAWTPERETKLLTDFDIDRSSIVKPTPKREKIFTDEQNKIISNIIKICTNNDKYTCPSCTDTKYEETESRSTFREHLVAHHIHPFICKICKRELYASNRNNAKKLKNCTGNGGKHEIIFNIKEMIGINLQQLLDQSKKLKEKPAVEKSTHQNNNNDTKIGEVRIDQATWDSLFGRNFITCITTDHAQNNNRNLSDTSTFNAESSMVQSQKESESMQEELPTDDEDNNNNNNNYEDDNTSMVTDNQLENHRANTNIQQSPNQSEKSSTEEPEVEECTQHQNKRPRTIDNDHAQDNNENFSSTSAFNAELLVVTNNQPPKEPILELIIQEESTDDEDLDN